MTDQADALEKAEALRDLLWKQVAGSGAYRLWAVASNMVEQIKSGGMDITPAGPHGFAANPKPPPPGKRERRFHGVSQGDAAVAVLDEAGHPMPTAELVEAIKAKGAKVGGKDPLINVSSTLSKDSRFVPRREGRGSVWWLSDRAWPVWDAPLDFDGATDADTSAVDQ